MVAEIPEDRDPFESFMPESVPFSFYLQPSSCLDIKDIINSIKGSSSGLDEVNITVIKRCMDEITHFLEYIINSSFVNGVFPSQLQIARVVPVSKKGDKSIYLNYRPISVLPVFSKIFEKLMKKEYLLFTT